MIRSEKTKQLLMNTILRVLEQHGRLTCSKLTYRMIFCKGNTAINYGRRRIIRYLLLPSNLAKVEYDKTIKKWGLKAVQAWKGC